MTILGYSLYDTVVVFDKVREKTADITHKPYTFDQGANRAVNQVMIRSINTTIIGILPVSAILLVGTFVLKGGPLAELGLALLVGMIAGTFSSLFIATPLLCQMRAVEPELKRHNEILQQRSVRKSGAAAGAKAKSQQGSVQAKARTLPKAAINLGDSNPYLTTADADSLSEVTPTPSVAAEPRPARMVPGERIQPSKSSRKNRKKK